MRAVLLTRLCLVLACLGLTACSERQEAVEFNNALNQGNHKLQAAQGAFFDAINRTREQGSLDLDAVRAAHQELLTAVDEVKAETAALVVPDSEAARQFLAAQQAFVAAEEKIYREDYQEMLDVLADDRLNNAEKRRRMEVIAERVSTQQAENLEAVQAAQEAFAQEYSLTLTPAAGS